MKRFTLVVLLMIAVMVVSYATTKACNYPNPVCATMTEMTAANFSPPTSTLPVHSIEMTTATVATHATPPTVAYNYTTIDETKTATTVPAMTSGSPPVAYVTNDWMAISTGATKKIPATAWTTDSTTPTTSIWATEYPKMRTNYAETNNADTNTGYLGVPRKAPAAEYFVCGGANGVNGLQNEATKKKSSVPVEAKHWT